MIAEKGKKRRRREERKEGRGAVVEMPRTGVESAYSTTSRAAMHSVLSFRSIDCSWVSDARTCRNVTKRALLVRHCKNGG